jgi:putative spermidine/putrescine transport system permease protein
MARLRPLLLVLLAAFIAGPFLELLLWSFARQWFWPSLLPSALTLRWYGWATFVPGVLHALRMSLEVACLATFLATAIGLPAAFVLARTRFPGRTFLRGVFAVPLVVPYISLGIGLATVFYRLHLTGTLAGVVLAHVVATLPFGIFILTAAIQDLPLELEEAALACGAGRWTTFRRVVLPLLAPSLLAAAVYVFTLSMDEFTLTMLVSSPATATLPVVIFASIGEGYFQITSALSIMLLMPSALTIYVMVRTFRPHALPVNAG